ncbi:MAG: hypothetical protein M0Z53_13955 [Thermaerobacter sp.]|nr:hypothetical protein [Thermaerobacter sp.]
MTIGLIRFDVEDYLTPESDAALIEMMDAMQEAGLPASYGLVGKKALALRARGANQALSRLGRESALGFHSHSHSEHPTLAEELAGLPYPQAVRAFIAREAPGVQAIREMTGGAPRYFTQPGGNWVPEAVDALPALGMEIFFSDAWNSYLIEWPEPLWYGSLLHLAPPVATPRPFLLGMPGNLPEALAIAEQLPVSQPDKQLAMVMLHPTELVTTRFWDAVNFSAGSTAPVLSPAPLRSTGDHQAALGALRRYLAALSRVPGVEWLDVMGLTARILPRAPVAVTREEVIRLVTANGLGPARAARGVLSAADLVWSLAYFAWRPGTSRVQAPVLAAPAKWSETAPISDPASVASVDQALREVVESGRRTGRLPGEVVVGGIRLPIDMVGRYAMSRMGSRDGRPVVPAALSLKFLQFVKQPDSLHWSWPVFPPGFQPFRLWLDAKRLAWSIAPVKWRGHEEG